MKKRSLTVVLAFILTTTLMACSNKTSTQNLLDFPTAADNYWEERIVEGSSASRQFLLGEYAKSGGWSVANNYEADAAIYMHFPFEFTYHISRNDLEGSTVGPPVIDAVDVTFSIYPNWMGDSHYEMNGKHYGQLFCITVDTTNTDAFLNDNHSLAHYYYIRESDGGIWGSDLDKEGFNVWIDTAYSSDDLLICSEADLKVIVALLNDLKEPAIYLDYLNFQGVLDALTYVDLTPIYGN